MHLLFLSILDKLLGIAYEVVKGVPLENREKFWDRYDARIERLEKRWEKILDGLTPNAPPDDPPK